MLGKKFSGRNVQHQLSSKELSGSSSHIGYSQQDKALGREEPADRNDQIEVNRHRHSRPEMKPMRWNKRARIDLIATEVKRMSL
jgi:hypothetical protein